MNENRLADYLDSKRQAPADACSLVEDLSKENILADRRTRQAVVISRVAIGEGATKAMDGYAEFADQHRKLPWRSIRGMRNRIASGYSHLSRSICFANSHGENDMKKLASGLALALVGSMIAVPPAIAGSATDTLSACVADNTTGKDRKDLAQWIFVAMTAHPEIKPFSNVTEANRDEVDKKLANLATRLLTGSCRSEAKAAMEKEGGESFEAAFGVLGKLAMQELMSNPSVSSSFTRYVKYLDKAKFDSAFAK